MPVHLSLQAAHDELGTTIEMTIDEVKSVYKKQALLHHPDRNQNSQESTEKFQRLSNAYDRIINPPKEPSFASPFGGGGMGGMGGFPRGGFAFTTPGGTFFFGGGGGRGGGFGDGFGGGGFGGGGGYYDGSDEEENYEDDYDEQEYDDEYEDEEDEDDDYDDYARFAYEDVLGGGFGTRASYRTYKAHHQQRETPEERAERIRVEAENIRKNEERRKNEAKWEKERREKEREEESRSAASRRALKKASQNAAKAASSSAASLAAFKRLQLAQLKRSAVFAALRTGDVEAAKKGVYDENVDPGTAGEWLEGGREAVEGLGEEEREALEREIQRVKAGGKGVAKTRQNAPAAAAAGGGGKGKGKKAAQTPVSPSPAPVESATSSAIVSAGAAKGGKGKKKGKGGKGDKKDDDEEAFWAELAKNVPAKIPTPPASVIETVPEKKSAAYDLDNENDDDDLPDLVDANGWADPVINQKMITAPPPKVEIPFEEMTKSQQKRFKKKQADEKKKAAPAEGGAATSAAKETEGAKEEEEEAKEEKEPAAAAESTPAAGGSSSKKGKGKKKKAGPSSAAPAEAPKTVTPPSPSTPTASVPTSPEILQKKKKGGASAPSTAPTSPEVSKDAGAEQELSQDEGETEKGEGDVVEYDPKETMLHLAVKRGDAGMVEWLISHGADPTARDSSSLSFFHLALLLSHLSILTSFLESSPPPFPAPDGAEELSSYSSDAFYPLPRGHSSLLSLALAGGVGKGGKHSLERVKAVRETVKASLPFSGGREIRQGWKKVEGEVKRVPSKKENVRNEWEEVKWAMAGRAKQLNFDEFSPPEEYLRRRRPVV